MHAKPSFAHRLEAAKMASFRTSAQNNGPRAQNNANAKKHGLRGFIGAVQRRLATQMVTMLTSRWQVLSEDELRRIFDVYKR